MNALLLALLVMLAPLDRGAMLREIAERGTPEQKAAALRVEERRAELRKADPLSCVRLLPWQQPLVALMLGLPWNEAAWGPGPTAPPRLVVVVAANQIGKSTAEGVVIASHVTGRSRRFTKPGEVWGGMPTLADSMNTQRKHVAAWLGESARPRWLPKERGQPHGSQCWTKQGWELHLKAFEQNVTAFESGTIQAAYLDEPPTDPILAALRARTAVNDGPILTIFTPIIDPRSNVGFRGTESALYKEMWGPWQEAKRGESLRWAEVLPRQWVFSVGARENAVSIGGYLPDERIEFDRQKLIEQGRPLEAAVRYDGEWVDMAEDRILPEWQTWGEDPRGGFGPKAAFIDPAYSESDSACRASIAVGARGMDGNAYLMDSVGGRWSPEVREQTFLDVLERHGFPRAFIQRGELAAIHALNAALQRKGHPQCIRPWPATGPIPDKVERGNYVAPMIANGQYRCRVEHGEVIAQSRVFSAAYIRARRGPVDDIDAAIGLGEVLFASPATASQFDDAVQGAAAVTYRDPSESRPRDQDEKPPDFLWGGGRSDMRNEID